MRGCVALSVRKPSCICRTHTDIETSAKADDLPADTPREWPFHFATGPSPRVGLKGGNGSGHDGPHFEYAAGKLPLRFWVPEAATRQRVLATLKRLPIHQVADIHGSGSSDPVGICKARHGFAAPRRPLLSEILPPLLSRSRVF
jgi:hypothetical protein